MMKPATFKALRSEFSVKAILDSFIGAFIFATILYAPVAIIMIELISVFMWLLTLLVILIIITLFAYVLLIHYFWWKSLTLKKADATTDIKKLFMKTSIIANIFMLAIGLIFLFVMIPILWV
jgi:hypothetical protein